MGPAEAFRGPSRAPAPKARRVAAVGREPERHVGGQRVDGGIGRARVQSHAADEDRDLRRARAQFGGGDQRAPVNVHRLCAVGADLRQRAETPFFDEPPVRSGREADDHLLGNGDDERARRAAAALAHDAHAARPFDLVAARARRRGGDRTRHVVHGWVGSGVRRAAAGRCEDDSAASDEAAVSALESVSRANAKMPAPRNSRPPKATPAHGISRRGRAAVSASTPNGLLSSSGCMRSPPRINWLGRGDCLPARRIRRAQKRRGGRKRPGAGPGLWMFLPERSSWRSPSARAQLPCCSRRAGRRSSRRAAGRRPRSAACPWPTSGGT